MATVRQKQRELLGQLITFEFQVPLLEDDEFGNDEFSSGKNLT